MWVETSTAVLLPGATRVSRAPMSISAKVWRLPPVRPHRKTIGQSSQPKWVAGGITVVAARATMSERAPAASTPGYRRSQRPSRDRHTGNASADPEWDHDVISSSTSGVAQPAFQPDNGHLVPSSSTSSCASIAVSLRRGSVDVRARTCMTRSCGPCRTWAIRSPSETMAPRILAASQSDRVSRNSVPMEVASICNWPTHKMVRSIMSNWGAIAVAMKRRLLRARGSVAASFDVVLTAKMQCRCA